MCCKQLGRSRNKSTKRCGSFMSLELCGNFKIFSFSLLFFIIRKNGQETLIFRASEGTFLNFKSSFFFYLIYTLTIFGNFSRLKLRKKLDIYWTRFIDSLKFKFYKIRFKLWAHFSRNVFSPTKCNNFLSFLIKNNYRAKFFHVNKLFSAPALLFCK